MHSTKLDSAIIAALCAACQGAAHAALQPRDLDGKPGTAEAYYDTVLNISWLADPNYPETLYLLSGGAAGLRGSISWASAKNFASSLNYHGITGWRLPTLTPMDGVSFHYNSANNGSSDIGQARNGIGWGTVSEMGHLFYLTLGLTGYCIPDDSRPWSCDGPQSGWSPTMTWNLPFTSYTPITAHWSNQAASPASDAEYGFVFDLSNGLQTTLRSDQSAGAWLVHAGDVGPVPEPGVWVLMAVGLIGLAWRRGSSVAACGAAS